VIEDMTISIAGEPAMDPQIEFVERGLLRSGRRHRSFKAQQSTYDERRASPDDSLP
jgi:hypothetical protein